MKNSIIFIFFELLNKAVPFLLLPVLTRFLTPNDYGMIASFSVFIAFTGIFIGLSAHGAVDANYFRLDKKKLGIYISNVLLVLTITVLITIVAVFFFNKIIFETLKLPLQWQIIGVIVTFSQFITLINLSLWVIEQEPKKYGVYQLLQTLVIMFIAIFLIVILHYSWQGQLLGTSIGIIVFALISLFSLRKRGYLGMNVKKAYIKDYLSFGVPMIPHQLGGWIRTQGDKLLLLAFVGISATGIFAVGQQIAIIMSLLMASLNKALYPILFKKIKNKMNISEKIKIVKVTYLLALGIIIIGLLLISVVFFLYPYIVGSKFQDGLIITQLMIFAFMLDGFYFLTVNYIFYFKKTSKLAKITFTVSLLHAMLSFLFINLFGVIGVVYALLISNFIQFMAIWHLSNKIYPMPWFYFIKEKNDVTG